MKDTVLNPLSIARRGKGLRGLVDRTGTISRRYGLTAQKMDHLLDRFAGILDAFNCGATFPITCAVLARNRATIEKFMARPIEFAVHGYFHVDHGELSVERLQTDLKRSRALFQAIGLRCEGFRAPYLRSSPATLRAVRDTGFQYESSQAIAWEVAEDRETDRYRTGLDFYGAVDSADCLSVPRLEDGLVRIPYSLPDDEALVERLAFSPGEDIAGPWLSILSATHKSGELFTLGLHPERILECERPLRAVLSAARALSPQVWIARLDEIAAWWKQRQDARTRIAQAGPDEYRISAAGPGGLRLIVRGGELLTASSHWYGDERIIAGSEVHVRAPKRPVIGVSHGSSPALDRFLEEQGYLVERTSEPGAYSLFIENAAFDRAAELPLLREIQSSSSPLVRLGRWPDGARSALSVTGDIDAITIRDYALRLVGR